MSEDLTNDELGEVAQAAFRQLCGKARLIANESSRDRAGWDFVVDLPMPVAGKSVLLDHRAPTSCRVQVKGTAGEADRVVLSLSVAERLAKDAGPAFVVVFRMGRRGALKVAVLAHLLDGPLAAVLRRLREAEAAGDYDIHKQSISFDLAKVGRPFRPTARGLRAALEVACGDDPSAYVAEKRRQLAEVGYEAGRYAFEITFAPTEQKDLEDILVGLKTLVATQITAFDKRFGIPVLEPSLSHSDGGEVGLEFEVFDTCPVTIRGAGVSPPAVFQGEARLLSDLTGGPAERDTIVVSTESLLLSLAVGNVGFRIKGPLNSLSLTLAQWVRLLRALSYLGQPGATITIAPGRLPQPHTMPVPLVIENPLIAKLSTLIDLLLQGERLLELAGVVHEPALGWAEIVAFSADLRLAGALLFGGAEHLPFRVRLADPSAPVDPPRVLFVDDVRLADVTIGYAAMLQYRLGNGDEGFVPAAATVLDVSVIPGDGFEAYADARRAATAGQAVIFAPRVKI